MQRASTGKFLKGSNEGSANPKWKGDKANYGSIHDYINYHFGKPKKCKHCGITDPLKRYEWASLTKFPTRNIEDWIRLCKSCHVKMDNSARGILAHNKQPVREKMSNNKSGYKNVFQDKRTGKFIPYIRIAKGKQKWLGKYDTAIEAYEMYKKTALEMYDTY